MPDNSKPREPASPKKDDLDDMLRRVDSLLTLDPGSPNEILGCDDDGLPTGTERAKLPDFGARAREILGDRILGDFLKYRHREWEENLCEETRPRGNAEDLLTGAE
jgi:hypothetical protein